MKMDEYPQEEVTLEERYRRFEKVIDKAMNSLARRGLITPHYFYDVRQELVLWVLTKKMPLHSWNPTTRKGFDAYNIVYRQGKLIAQEVRTSQVTPNPARAFAIETVREQIMALTPEEWVRIAETRGEIRAFTKFSRFSKVVWGLHKMNGRHFDRIAELTPVVIENIKAGMRVGDFKEYGSLNYLLQILTTIINTYWSFEDTDECTGANIYGSAQRKYRRELESQGDSINEIQYY